MRVWRLRALDGRLRRAWLLLTCSFILYTTGNVFWTYYENVLNIKPALTWVDGIYLASYPVLLLGLLQFPEAFRSSGERRRFWLDLGTVVVGVGMVLWYLLIRPVVNAEHNEAFETAISIAYPVSDFVLLFGFSVIRLRRRRADSRNTMLFFAFAMCFNLVGDLAYSVQGLSGTYVTGNYPEICWYLTLFAYTLSAHCQYREAVVAVQNTLTAEPIANTINHQSANADTETPRFSVLPYVSIAIGYGILLYVTYSHEDTDDSHPINGLIVGSVILTAFVVARQVIAVRENIRLQAENAKRESEMRFRSLVQHSSDVISIIDENLVIRYVSPSSERVFGYAPEDIIGSKFQEFIHPEEARQASDYFENLLDAGNFVAPVDLRFQNRRGDWLWVENTGNNLFADKNVRGIVINSRDVSDRKRAEERLLHDAFHDVLTGLPNRALFLDHLKLALNRAKRHSKCHFSVLFVDLDRFKFVNDSTGHLAGDKLLIEIARRLEECVRPSDTVARLGGDEFTILLEDFDRPNVSTEVAERIQKQISASFDLDGREVFVTASIGIAPGNAAYQVAEDLLRDADTAMYYAKESGKARFEIFDQEMHARDKAG